MTLAAEGRVEPAIVWFRDDLRLADHPALTAAVASGAPILCLYVLEEDPSQRPLGAASRWWLDKSLGALDAAIAARGGKLILRRGSALSVVPEVVRETGAGSLFFNSRHDRPGMAIDDAIAARLAVDGVAVSSHVGNLLAEPETILTGTGGFYRVFTPFWRALAARLDDLAGLGPAPARLPAPETLPASDDLAAWGLQPRAPDWSGGLAKAWHPGEAPARSRLVAFLEDPAARYADDRDFPAADGVSRLSPHLRFGEISPARVVVAVHQAVADRRLPHAASDKFLAEVGWREFCRHLLFHFPALATENFQPAFDGFPWRRDDDAFAAWTAGRTGYPIVDAGMRELWATGTMHNRVRMIVASFLAKDLMIDWRAGEAWFWDTLCDADPASNPANWQWVAGSGADAAPYFRVFNPVLQGEKFDPGGRYARHWLPEIAALPDRFVHKPFAAPVALRPNGYPPPIVDHQAARTRALAAFHGLRS